MIFISEVKCLWFVNSVLNFNLYGLSKVFCQEERQLIKVTCPKRVFFLILLYSYMIGSILAWSISAVMFCVCVQPILYPIQREQKKSIHLRLGINLPQCFGSILL